MSDSYYTYGVNFSVIGEKHYKIVENWLLKSDLINDFISPVPLFYIIKSHVNASVIAQDMAFLFPEGGFLICGLNKADLNGIIHRNYWDWIYDRDTSVGRKKIALAARLGYG